MNSGQLAWILVVAAATATACGGGDSAVTGAAGADQTGAAGEGGTGGGGTLGGSGGGGGAAATGAAGTAGESAQLCPAVCEIVAQVGCENMDPSECLSECAESAAQEHCSGEEYALLQCEAGTSVDDYYCGEYGTPLTREGVCEPEIDAYLDCSADY